MPLSAHVDLGRLDQPFPDVRLKGRQATHQHQVDQQVQVSAHRLAIDRKSAREVGGVEQAALHVSEHRPETAKRGGWNARPELRDVPFEVRANERFAPREAVRVIGREKALRKAAPNPEVGVLLRRDLQDVERRQLHVGEPAGKRLGLTQQIGRRRTKKEKSPGPLAAPAPGIDQPAEDREQLGHALNLVDDNEPVFVSRQVELRISELVAVPRRFEVQVDTVPLRGDPLCQCRLANLARPQQCHRSCVTKSFFDNIL